MEQHQEFLNGCGPSRTTHDPACPNVTSCEHAKGNHRTSPQLVLERANTIQKQRRTTTRRAAIVDFDD